VLCDEKMRSTVPGLYAAGDVVHGLDQISHAMGEGGQAATTIRNDLAAQTPLLREPCLSQTELEEAQAGT
jgi:thioredoxin reductase (NADPH)